MQQYHAPIQYKRRKTKRRYGKTKLHINVTVLFFVLFIAACTIGAVILGNYLKGKVTPNDMSDDTDGGGVSRAPDNGAAMIPGSASDAAQVHDNVRSGCLYVDGGDGPDEIKSKALAIFDCGYDSVTIPLTDKNGALRFRSDAAAALSRQDADSSLPNLGDAVSAVRAAAAERSLHARVSVYYAMTYKTIDDPVIAEATLLYETAVISESYSLGADAVVLTGISGGGSVDKDEILGVIERLRSSSPDIKLVLALPFSSFTDVKNPAELDELAQAAGCLAVDATTLDWSYSEETRTHTEYGEGGEPFDVTDTVRTSHIFDELDAASSSIKSSVSLYSLGFILRGDVKYNESEAVDALIKNGIYSYYVVSAPEQPDDTEGGGDETDGVETDVETDGPVE